MRPYHIPRGTLAAPASGTPGQLPRACAPRASGCAGRAPPPRPGQPARPGRVDEEDRSTYRAFTMKARFGQEAACGRPAHGWANLRALGGHGAGAELAAFVEAPGHPARVRIAPFPAHINHRICVAIRCRARPFPVRPLRAHRGDRGGRAHPRPGRWSPGPSLHRARGSRRRPQPLVGDSGHAMHPANHRPSWIYERARGAVARAGVAPAIFRTKA